MHKKILKFGAWAFAAMSPIFCVCSCMVDSYELDDIDKSISIQTDVGVPIGNTELISIVTLLDLGDFSRLYEDDEGYYYFSFNSEPFSETIQISRFKLGDGDFIEDVNIGLSPVNLKYKIYDANSDKISDPMDSFPLAGLDTLSVDDIIEGGSKSDSFSITEDVSDLAADIEEISYIYLDAPVKVNVSIIPIKGDEKAVATKGFRISFPEYMDISFDSEDFLLEDSHTIVLNKDVKITSTEALEMNFLLDGIDMLALKKQSNGELGYVGDSETRYIKIEGEVEASDLVLKFNPADYGTTLGDVPENLEFDIDFEFEYFSVSAAEVRMCSELEIEDQEVDIDMFDSFEGDDNIINFYNPLIALNVANSSPVAAGFSSKLQSYAEGHEAEIAIGSEASPVIFRNFEDASTCRSTVYISRKSVEMSSDSDYTENIVIEELSDIFTHLPDKVSISDIKLSAYYENETDYSLIQFSDSETLEYGFEFEYWVNLPLAFDEDLYISYFYDIAGLGDLLNSESGNSGAYLNTATIKMTFVNTIPLQMNLTASVLGVDGNILESEDLEIEISSGAGGEAIVTGGNTDSPQESEILLVLSSEGQIPEDFDGFRLNITAVSSEELAGLQLNSSQYIQIKDITLHFDGGINLDVEL